MTPSYLEKVDSQVPAIQLLCALGWTYLDREQARALRGNRLDRVVLTEVLHPWMREHNSFEAKGTTHRFTDAAIVEAMRRITDVPFDGLVRTNETIYHRLVLGTSVEQTVDDDRKGRQLQFIDWQHPEQNVFHVTDEFAVERTHSNEVLRLDLVLFINGIPVVAVECKRRDQKKAIDQAIGDLVSYQKDDQIPQLFPFIQLLFATNVNETPYATVGSQREFWAVWREDGDHHLALEAAASQRLPAQVESRVFAPMHDIERSEANSARQKYEAQWQEPYRTPTEQDRTFWAMLRPNRLVEFIHDGVIFDGGKRKVARYQQWFAVKATVKRAATLVQGRRRGGVIWHTTGSGKSLTMVMLANGLANHPGIEHPRIVLVTDRVGLDDQLKRTFDAAGKTSERAKSGEHLKRLIKENRANVISTVIDKFDTVLSTYGVQDDDPNIFVLVDEGHRSNYGSTAAKMRKVFPNACFIGFTGTPLLKEDKNTSEKFGGFLHAYTMREAVEDHAVVPLYYEGRVAPLSSVEGPLTTWFERLTDKLSPEQKRDLKKKMTRNEELTRAEQRIQAIAYDISLHYKTKWQGTGFKAQLAADSRTSALRYRKYLQQFGMVSCDVIMSEPGINEGVSEDDEDTQLVTRFWDEMMKQYGTEKSYNDTIKASFGRADGVEILIVVDKLLTGFDEPRNTVMYLDKPLKQHTLLQAIARVNRLCEGKTYGYIIDYRGVLTELGEAMQTYDALAGFDPSDVDFTGAVTNVAEMIARIEEDRTNVWAVFKEVRNKGDNESFEQFLKPPDRRQAFYEVLRQYQRTLSVALGSESIYDRYSIQQVDSFKDDLKFFRSLRTAVQVRYAEKVDYSLYEKQIRKMLDTHIHAAEVEVLTKQVDIFNKKAFEKELAAKQGGAASKADTIAHHLAKTCRERLEEDPVFFAKFGKLVQEAIDEYQQGRIDELAYLKKVQALLETIRSGRESDQPTILEGSAHTEARAFYGVLGEELEAMGIAANERREMASGMALELEKLIEPLKIVDWVHSPDAVNKLKGAIDDFLFDAPKQFGVKLETPTIDRLLPRLMGITTKLAGV